MKIEVTQADIDKAMPCQAYDCPIAIAMSRVFNCPIGVCLDGLWWLASDGELGPGDSHPLPPEAIEFALAFDEGKTVEPFTFKIRKPRKSAMP